MTVKTGHESLSVNPTENRKLFPLAMLIVFGLFLSLYLAFSFAFAQTPAFGEFNILFGKDTPRAIADMTWPDAIHYRTNVHPLYVLITNPIGTFMAWVLKSETNAAIILNCFFAALDVTFALIFFYYAGHTLIDALLLTSLFGLSASQLLLSVIPETSSLAVLSLIVTYLLFVIALKRKTLPLVFWVLAGIFSLGVTTTNLVQTIICFAVYVHATSVHATSNKTRIGYVFKQLIRFLGWTLLGSMVLSLIQKVIYPTTNVFFLPQVYKEDAQYISFLVFQSPIKVLIPLVEHFWLVNFIAPYPFIFSMPESGPLPAITFVQSTTFSTAGWMAILLWLSFLALRIKKFLFNNNLDQSRHVVWPMLTGFVLCLLFNLIFHSIYGIQGQGQIEYFLYTGNFTFLVLGSLAAYPFSLKPFFRVLLFALIPLMSINNFLVLREIINLYSK